jgi:hypothetical protein
VEEAICKAGAGGQLRPNQTLQLTATRTAFSFIVTSVILVSVLAAFPAPVVTMSLAILPPAVLSALETRGRCRSDSDRSLCPSMRRLIGQLFTAVDPRIFEQRITPLIAAEIT